MMKRVDRLSRRILTTSWVTAMLVCISVAQGTEHDWLYDWPNWRGPQQNRISAETGLVDKWNPRGGQGSNLLWKNDALAGRSTPIVLGERLYTMVRHNPGTPTEGEKVVCADVATGDILWEHRFNVYLSDVPDTRLGWSSCVADPAADRIYAQSVSGYFCCLDGESGDVVWERSLHEEFGFLSTYGGRTNVPVVYEDTVLTSAVVIGWGDTPKWGNLAKPAHRFMAFDKATGQLRWLDGTGISPTDTTYSTPTIQTLQHVGMDAMVFGSGDGHVWAMQPGTGKPIWKYHFSRRGVNTSPFVTPWGAVYMGHSEENIVGNTMGSIVALEGDWSPDSAPEKGKDGVPIARALWQHYEYMVGKSSPVLYGNRIYFVDDRAKMFVFDMDGKLIQRKPLGTVMRSTPLFADGKIYLCTNNGRWYILEPTDDGVRIVHRLRLSGEASDGSPIVSRGRIFVPTSETMYCLGREDHEPALDMDVAAQGFEPPSGPARGGDDTPTHVQVVPYDVLLKPGESQKFSVRLFNSHGNFLREASADDAGFRVDGPGEVSSNGSYTAPANAGHQCALVTCTVGNVTGTARIRIVPPLPWQFDFEGDDDVPLTWVGGRVRYVLSDIGDSRVMVKRNVLPTPRDPNNKLGTRSQMWMGSTDLAAYTMQADVMLPIGEATAASDTSGEEPEFPSDLPPGATRQGDLGLINSRYTFALYGASQEVRLYSWCTHDKRTQAALPFAIDPRTWYTLKVRVEPRADDALVQGKAWVRGEPEPDQWTLEITDPAPNLHGSPGLFGNAKDAEIFVDNVSVTAND